MSALRVDATERPPEIRSIECLRDAEELLRAALRQGKPVVTVERVYRVWSAGDSGAGCETMLFTTKERTAMTAYVSDSGEEVHVSLAEGW